MCLLDVKLHFFPFAVVAIAQIELWRSRTVDPLIEEFVDVDVGRLFDRLPKICRHHVIAAVDFQVVLQGVVKDLVTKLVMKHVQYPAGLFVSVSIKFAFV